MQFKKSTLVGVVITVYLSTASWCHYIPEEKQQSQGSQNNDTSGSSYHIQICGSELTNFLLEACDWIVSSPNQGNLSKGSVRTKITEKCCDNACPLEYLQNYCGNVLLFSLKNLRKGTLLNKLNIRGRTTGTGKDRGMPRKDRSKTATEVRINEKPRKKKKVGKKGRKKRKRSFKWKCAYKSFGHFLLKLHRNADAPTNMAKRHNNINRSWPSIQVGTISPEIEKFGGRPTVVVKKNKSNNI